ncbi:MAG: hypothetical protein QXT92_04005, partial [Nitrososphaerota archaeon]
MYIAIENIVHVVIAIIPRPPISLGTFVINSVIPHRAFIDPCREAVGIMLDDIFLTRIYGVVQEIVNNV